MKKPAFSDNKKTIFHFVIIAVMLIAGAYAVFIIPSAVRSFIPKVNTVFPSVMEYTPTVSCSGSLEYSDLYYIGCEIPLVISEYCVNEGDRIDNGQLIAKVDVTKTLEKLTALYEASAASGEITTLSAADIPNQIISDVSGVVFSLSKQGELIGAGDSIAAIGDKGDLVLKAAVSERHIARVSPGQTVTVTAAASQNEYNGVVQSVSSCARKAYNGITEETVVDIVVSLDEPKDELKSGFSAQGVIKTGISQQMMTLPYSAICQDDKGEYVYVFKNGSAVRKDITTGLEMSGAAQISGINESDEVIIDTDGITAFLPVIRQEN